MKNLFTLLLFGCLFSSSYAQPSTPRITLNPSLRPFYHGVESGDPTENSVIIWTRVTPDSGVTGDVKVYWQIATDVNFNNVVNYGSLTATAENHYCVKEDVCGLQPASFYYYMFQSGGRNSVIGRTKTAPAATANNDSVRFAVVSCASWEHGYFNAYQSVSNRNDVDAVVHLGDYIYEYASGDFSGNVTGRTYEPANECITESGYELRYSQYKLDDQLRRIHQLFPFITVWDDHETANDSYRDGADNHTPGTEGSFADRKRNSTSTYFKWMPIRKPDPLDTIRIFRRLRYGKLLDLIMLDTRLYDRDEQDLAQRNSTTRHMMGPAERAWFLTQLSDTTTRWKIIGNQVMFAPLEVFGQPVNADQWDGYNYERGLIQNHILNNNIKDVVMLTGDIHTSWCNDVPGSNYDANSGNGSICVEFVGSSVTSLNSPLPIGAGLIQTLNPHMKYINLDDHGYYILDVKKTKTQADYTFVSTVDQLGATDAAGPHFYVNDNERYLRQSLSAVAAPAITAANPPLLPTQSIMVYKIENLYVGTTENTQVSLNAIPAIPTCPARTITIGQPQHGVALTFSGVQVTYSPQTNYYGTDTFQIITCTTQTLPVCDTFLVFVTVTGGQDVDSTIVTLATDSVYSHCISFNDLTTPAASLSYSSPATGTLQVSDSCFVFTPDSLYCGTQPVEFIACDSSSFCDTVLYLFTVQHPVAAEQSTVTIPKNSNYTYCHYFNDLLFAPLSITTTQLPQHGTFQSQADTCIKYFPHFNYTGSDTMRFVGCDNCGTNHCDTVTLVFQIENPNAVTDIKPVVLGMYPNPVNTLLTIQYFLYQTEDVTVNVFDALGKKCMSKKVSAVSSGLQHLQLNTENLPAGNYLVELQTLSGGYSGRIVKE